MQLILAPLTSIIVGLVVAAYLRWFAEGISRDRMFERWCADHPLVLAIRCHDDGDRLLRIALLERLGRARQVMNPHGRFPWAFYQLRFDVIARDGSVELRIACATLVRGERRPARLLDLLEGLDPEVIARVDEIWMHGELFPGRQHTGSDRGRFGWTGHLGPDGLAMHEMIGKPAWLGESATTTERATAQTPTEDTSAAPASSLRAPRQLRATAHESVQILP